jgi:hypothetical protein
MIRANYRSIAGVSATGKLMAQMGAENMEFRERSKIFRSKFIRVLSADNSLKHIPLMKFFELMICESLNHYVKFAQYH